MEPLKAEQLSSTKWRVLAIPFGGMFKGGKDLDGEFFTPQTDIKADWFRERPVIIDHGRDSELQSDAIGVQDELVKSDEGWWGTVWLNRQARYFAQINSLMAAGKAYGSSGSMGHLVKFARDAGGRKTGEILVWPHVEQTITPVPINLLSRVVPAKAVDDFTSAGITLGADLETYLADKAGESPANPELTETLDLLRGLIQTI